MNGSSAAAAAAAAATGAPPNLQTSVILNRSLQNSIERTYNQIVSDDPSISVPYFYFELLSIKRTGRVIVQKMRSGHWASTFFLAFEANTFAAIGRAWKRAWRPNLSLPHLDAFGEFVDCKGCRIMYFCIHTNHPHNFSGFPGNLKVGIDYATSAVRYYAANLESVVRSNPG